MKGRVLETPDVEHSRNVKTIKTQLRNKLMIDVKACNNSLKQLKLS